MFIDFSIFSKKFRLQLDWKYLSIFFDYRGDWVAFHLNPYFWFKGEAFYSTSFCANFPSLKALNRYWDEYCDVCRKICEQLDNQENVSETNEPIMKINITKEEAEKQFEQFVENVEKAKNNWKTIF